jgi:ADP-heptose:LPS heptosyltransferase
MKIAILLLNNNGDILYATPIAKQIKEQDFPNAHLTWIVSRQCADILRNNHFIDNLEIVDLQNINEIYQSRWIEIKSIYTQKLKNGEYDKLFVLQPFDQNFLHYKTSIRQMILDSYTKSLNVSLKPIISLTAKEKENVVSFIKRNKISDFTNRILFEFSPSSGQTNISLSDALNIASQIVNKIESTCVILSSKLDYVIAENNIFNAKDLTFKENAELINNCTLLIGCSSGISWLGTSEYCKLLPTVQFLNSNAPWFNSMKADFEGNGFNSDHVLELYHFDRQLILEAVLYSIKYGFPKAKQKYDQPFKDSYLLNNFFSISNYFSAAGAYKSLVVFLFKNLTKSSSLLKHNIKSLVAIFKKKIHSSLSTSVNL